MKMKRVLAAIAAALVLATSAVCLTACGGGTATDSGAVDYTQSLDGTTWIVTSVEKGGKEVSAAMRNATATFTADQMILSYDGTTDYVDYTLSNGVINAEDVMGTVNGDQIRFQYGGWVLIMKNAESARIQSLNGTSWTITKIIYEDGEEYSPMNGSWVTFTENEMIITIGGEDKYVAYTYENGMINAEGITSVVNYDEILLTQGDRTLQLELADGKTGVDSLPGTNSAQGVTSGDQTSLVGTNWELIKITRGGADISDQIPTLGGVTVTFTADEMIMTAGLGQSDHFDYTYANGEIDVAGVEGTVNGDTLRLTMGNEEMVLKRK